MTIHFSFVRSQDGEESIVILGSKGTRLIPASHLSFTRLKEALFNGADEDEAYALADAKATLTNTLTRLSERVVLKGEELYFDGDLQETKLSAHIIEMVRNGDENYEGYVKFLENLATNPSKKSRKHLFAFLDKHDLVITEDGSFIGYKGIASDGLSVTRGNQDVTVTLEDGTIEVHNGRIPNPVGATVEMPRSLVDPDRDTACSVGLHVGNHNYANGFGAVLLTVKVNPRDVVSVPSDSNDEKIRTARYTVLEVNDSRIRYEGTSWTANTEEVEDGFEDDDEEQEEDYSCSLCGETECRY